MATLGGPDTLCCPRRRRNARSFVHWSQAEGLSTSRELPRAVLSLSNEAETIMMTCRKALQWNLQKTGARNKHRGDDPIRPEQAHRRAGPARDTWQGTQPSRKHTDYTPHGQPGKPEQGQSNITMKNIAEAATTRQGNLAMPKDTHTQCTAARGQPGTPGKAPRTSNAETVMIKCCNARQGDLHKAGACDKHRGDGPIIQGHLEQPTPQSKCTAARGQPRTPCKSTQPSRKHLC